MSREDDQTITIPISMFRELQESTVKAAVLQGRVAAMMSSNAALLTENRDELRLIRSERKDVWPLIEKLQTLLEADIARERAEAHEAGRVQGLAEGRAEAPIATAITAGVADALRSERGKATVKAIVLILLVAATGFLAAYFGVTP